MSRGKKITAKSALASPNRVTRALHATNATGYFSINNQKIDINNLPKELKSHPVLPHQPEFVNHDWWQLTHDLMTTSANPNKEQVYGWCNELQGKTVVIDRILSHLNLDGHTPKEILLDRDKLVPFAATLSLFNASVAKEVLVFACDEMGKELRNNSLSTKDMGLRYTLRDVINTADHQFIEKFNNSVCHLDPSLEIYNNAWQAIIAEFPERALKIINNRQRNIILAAERVFELKEQGLVKQAYNLNAILTQIPDARYYLPRVLPRLKELKDLAYPNL